MRSWPAPPSASRPAKPAERFRVQAGLLFEVVRWLDYPVGARRLRQLPGEVAQVQSDQKALLRCLTLRLLRLVPLVQRRPLSQSISSEGEHHLRRR